jgi:gliding motility-associated-like protein
MKIHLFFKTVIFFFLFSFNYFYLSAQTYVFAQLSGSPMNTKGWNLQGSAKVSNILNNDMSEMMLVPVGTFLSGAVFYNQPINLGLCNKWQAEFDFRIYDGTGADGLAFCFLDVPPVGFVTGSGLGIPATANGLKVCFDTYNNCASPFTLNMPKVELRWGTGYTECSNLPTADNSSGNLSFIRSGTYNHALITYNNGNISVSVNNQLIITGTQQFTFSGYLGFTASTGGYYDNHSIKNVIIYTDMPPSVASTVSTNEACANNNIQLGTTSNSGYVYSWTPTTGLNNPSVSNPILQLNNISDSLQSYKYYVNTSYANNPGCASVDSVVVSIHPRPIINFITPEICLSDATALFTDSSYSKDVSNFPFNYHWYFDDALNSNNANTDTSVQQNPSHKYSNASIYRVQLKITTANGCIDSLTKPFTVNGSVPRADFNVVSVSTICSKDSVQIKDNSSVDFGSLTRVEIYWDAINQPNSFITDNNPSFGKIYTNHYANFQQPISKTYTIRYIVYSGITCVNEIDKTITIAASPQVIFNTIPSICDNVSPIQITEAFETSGMAGQAFYTGTGIGTTGLFDPSISGAGNFLIQYKFIGNDGCFDTASQFITVWPHPQVNAGSEMFVLDGSSATINATASGNQLSFLWSPNIYLNNDTTLTPITTPHQNTLYTITATDSNFCSVSDSVFVKVLFVPKVPNAFSPNGDGINDKWEIKYLNDYPECTVEIFTRTGQMIFQSYGYATPWDGTYHGSALPIGTYYYIIQPGRGRATISGSVTILR